MGMQTNAAKTVSEQRRTKWNSHLNGQQLAQTLCISCGVFNTYRSIEADVRRSVQTARNILCELDQVWNSKDKQKHQEQSF